MKTRLLTALLGFGLIAQAQTVNYFWYKYDAAGNRTQRKFTVTNSIPPSFRKANMGDTISEPTKPVDKTPEVLQMAGYRVTIYPNPTLGHLKIEVANFPTHQEAYYYIFNVSGTTIIPKTPYNQSVDIDLTAYPTGLYVLRNIIGNDIKDWKIVKE
jgi:hypothetical protein